MTGRKRPKGFAPWKPTAETRATLDQVIETLYEQQDYWPLTVRQLFYACIGKDIIPKTKNMADTIGDWMVRARRSGMVPFDAIRDDTETIITPYFSSSRPWTPAEEAESLRLRSLAWNRNRAEGQPVHVEVWTEAAGMSGQVARRVGAEYGVSVYSSGGFNSLTAKHRAFRRFCSAGRPVVVLHVGDHDPSGESIKDTAEEDIVQFCLDQGVVDAVPTFLRPAVTPQQIVDLDLPTVPPNPKDKRDNDIEMAVQAEAIPPGTLLDIIEDAVLEHIDLDQLDAVREAELEDRRNIDAWVESLDLEAS